MDKIINYIKSKPEGIWLTIAHKLGLHDNCIQYQDLECWCF